MPEIQLNAASKKLCDAYVASPSHALLLTGSSGVGLRTVANHLASVIAGGTSLVTLIEPEKGVISIDRIRLLYEQTRSVQATRRCIVIDDADTMRPETQNALLKLLEEPVENVHFILTSHVPVRVLATIRSRAQHIALLPIGEHASHALIDSYNLDKTRQRQTLFLAEGLPAELVRLCEHTEYFDTQASVVSDARRFLQASTYDKLTIIKNYTDRSTTLVFLAMGAKLLGFSLLKQKNFTAAQQMDVFDTAMKRIEANGHVRTHLMRLVTKLP